MWKRVIALGDRLHAVRRLRRGQSNILNECRRGRRRQPTFAPSVHAALGELAYESGQVRRSARAFRKGQAALWTDDLPDAASVEARCYLAWLDGARAQASGRLETGRDQRAAGQGDGPAGAGSALSRLSASPSSASTNGDMSMRWRRGWTEFRSRVSERSVPRCWRRFTTGAAARHGRGRRSDRRRR